MVQIYNLSSEKAAKQHQLEQVRSLLSVHGKFQASGQSSPTYITYLKNKQGCTKYEVCLFKCMFVLR